MKTTMLPEEPDAKSPAGADIRFLLNGKTGNRNSISIPKCFRHRIEVHLHRHAALARRIRSYLCQGYMADNNLMLFYRSEEQNREKMANTACP